MTHVDPAELALEPLLKIGARALDSITVEPTWVDSVRRAAQQGVVVYVLRHLSLVDYIALDYVTRRFGLPEIGYAQDLGPLPWVGGSVGKARRWLEFLWPLQSRSPAEQTKALLASQLTELPSSERHGPSSVLLFLKRRPNLLEGGGWHRRAKSEGDEVLRAVLEMQHDASRPILLVPQTFTWARRPGDHQPHLPDLLLGTREYPGNVRSAMHFLLRSQHVTLRGADPVNLASLLHLETEATGIEPDPERLVRRVTYALMTRIERERRAALGPVKKPADRVRDEIIRSPKLQSIIQGLAGEGKAEQAIVTARAYRMLLELEALPDPGAVHAFELALDVVVKRLFEGIEIDQPGLDQVREAYKRGTVVFLPSHKSHVDYLILSYVLTRAGLQPPLVAAGDNLKFFPMGPLFRRGGAFFIRRSFRGDRLYTAVVEAYLRRLVRDGWPLEFFLEGGRSRTGKLLSPKVGLLTFVCDAALSLPQREVSFVPVSIGYERLPEEHSYAREMSGGEKHKESAEAMLRGSRVLTQFYGRVNLQLGSPLTLDEVRQQLGVRDVPLTPATRRAVIQRMAHLVMAEINRVSLVTPGALVATALLLGNRRGVPHVELVATCRRLLAVVQRWGARISTSLVAPDGAFRPQSIRDAAQMFAQGDLIEAVIPGQNATDLASHRKERWRSWVPDLASHARHTALPSDSDDVIYQVPESKRLSLAIPKNGMLHFFTSHSLISTALRVRSGWPVPVDTLRDRVQTLSRLFKHELMFRADAAFDTIFDESLAQMIHEGDVSYVDPQRVAPGPGHDGESGVGWIELYADLLRPFLEGYRVVARTVTQLRKGPLTEKELVRRALVVGEKMFLSGELLHKEAISRPVFENAIPALEGLAYLVSEGGKLQLTEGFSSQEAAATIEARISLFLR